MRFYFYTGSPDLYEIEQSYRITQKSRTIFSPAPIGVYLTSTTPSVFQSENYREYFESYVEVELDAHDPMLIKCGPNGKLEVYYYQENIDLTQFNWKSGKITAWEEASGINWKLVAGVAAVGIGASVLGKVAHDAYQQKTKDKSKAHVENLLSLGWEDGVGKRGSRKSKSTEIESFVNIGQKAISNLSTYEPPISDGSVSDFVSAFEYRRERNFASEDDGIVKKSAGFINNIDNKADMIGTLFSESKRHISSITKLVEKNGSTGEDEWDLVDEDAKDMEEEFQMIESKLNKQPSQINQLERLYASRIKVDETKQKEYKSLMKNLVGEIISKMKRNSKTFSALFKEIYYGGSVFDGLKVNSTEQEFDLNLLFKWKAKDLEVTRLGEDLEKKNFCYLKATKINLNAFEERILDTDSYGPQPGSKYLSPIKMFNLIKSTVDKVLTNEDNYIRYENHWYRITRHENAPVTLKVISMDKCPTMSFEIDLVPSLKLELDVLKNNPGLKGEADKLSDKYGVSWDARSLMAISLHRADKHKFEIDFHDLERKILFDRGCVKKVIKLIKYLRDSKGGPAEKLWSHLLKV